MEPLKDTRSNAEAAKEAMNGFEFRGRELRVRFSLQLSALRVKEIPLAVSNELLFAVSGMLAAHTRFSEA